jgi:hypothetical protein
MSCAHKQKVKLRKKLWHANPHCENCGTLTVLPEHIEGERISGMPINIPDNMATIQHKYSRNHPLRHTKNDRNERRRLLWCHKCNRDYNHMYENKY